MIEDFSSDSGFKDQHYGLVSVLYHTLKEIKNCQQFKLDAEDAEDVELQDFFQEMTAEDQMRVHRLKGMLTNRLAEEDDDLDEGFDDLDMSVTSADYSSDTRLS